MSMLAWIIAAASPLMAWLCVRWKEVNLAALWIVANACCVCLDVTRGFAVQAAVHAVCFGANVYVIWRFGIREREAPRAEGGG
jgi:hypothetical protein